MVSRGYGCGEPGAAREGIVDGVDGADVVAAGTDQVGTDAAVCRECGKGVPVAGDGLMSFRTFEGLFGGVVGPGHGEVSGEQRDLLGLVTQACREVVSGVVALGPVAVTVGGDSPRNRFVVASPQVGEQLGIELIAAFGLGGGDRGGGLAQHRDDLPGPLLLGGVALQDAFGVADQVSIMPISA